MADEKEKPTDKSYTDRPQIASLTLEEHGWLAARLLQQKKRNGREDSAWKAELSVVLSSTPLLAPVLKMLNDESGDPPESNSSRKARRRKSFDNLAPEVIDAALRVVHSSSMPALGDGLRFLVTQEVERTIWQTNTAKAIRWLIPSVSVLLVSVIAGGSIWGGIKFDGLLKLAQDTRSSIEKNLNDVNNEASKAQDSLRIIRDNAQTEIDKKIEAEVQRRTGNLNKVLAEAQRKAEEELGKNLERLKEHAEKSIEAFTQAERSAESEIDKKLDGLKERLAKSTDAFAQAQQTAQGEIDKNLGGLKQQLEKLVEAFSQAHRNAQNDADTKLAGLKEQFGKTNESYAQQSDQLFRSRREATDKLWQTQEENWNKILGDRKDVILDHFGTLQTNVDVKAKAINTNLDATLRIARQKVPELQEEIEALQTQLGRVGEKIVSADTRVTDLIAGQNEKVGALFAAKEELDSLITKLEAASTTVGLKWLLRAIEIKDGLAVAAVILSLLCLLAVFFPGLVERLRQMRPWRARTSEPSRRDIE